MLDFHLSYQPPSSIDPLPSPASCICPARVASRFSVGMVCSKFLSSLSLATGNLARAAGVVPMGSNTLRELRFTLGFRIQGPCSGPSGCWSISSLTIFFSQWPSGHLPIYQGVFAGYTSFVFCSTWDCVVCL